MPAKPARKPQRQPVKPPFSTISGLELEPVYGPGDLPKSVAKRSASREIPVHARPYPNMYRGKRWTMRQFAGFGSAKDTNERFKYLLAHGTEGSPRPSICPL
jgi:methylmalonyl-CoA mutase N-terminal domain/subunit